MKNSNQVFCCNEKTKTFSQIEVPGNQKTAIHIITTLRGKGFDVLMSDIRKCIALDGCGEWHVVFGETLHSIDPNNPTIKTERKLFAKLRNLSALILS